jgi:hypothetical protein
VRVEGEKAERLIQTEERSVLVDGQMMPRERLSGPDLEVIRDAGNQVRLQIRYAEIVGRGKDDLILSW